VKQNGPEQLASNQAVPSFYSVTLDLMKTVPALHFSENSLLRWPALGLALLVGLRAVTPCEAGGTVVAWGANDSLQSQVPPGLTNVVAVAGGESHSLALRGDGSVVAWGFNLSGQTNVPSNLTDATAIAAGQTFSLALRSNRTVSVWGGLGAAPAGLSNVVAIAGGLSHALALRSDGTVVSWGSQTAVPANVSNVVAIAAGNGQSLALKADTTVVAWGDDAYGKAEVPVGLANVVAIAAGQDHCLALRFNGSVVAWGRSDSGQTTVPTGLTNALAIGAGVAHSVALKADGTLAAWGDDTYSQVTATPAANGFTAVGAGGYHSLAIKGDGFPVIVLQPLSQIVPTGRNASFQVAALGAPTLQYQWWRNGSMLTGATRSALTVTNIQLSDGSTNTVVVSNALGSVTSAPAVLTPVGVAPSITVAPHDTNIFCGEAALFQATVDGSAPLTYQWQLNGAPIAGATKASLLVTNADPSQAGQYSLGVTNAFGSVATSAVLTVTVVAPTITSPLTGAGVQGVAFTYTITALHSPISFSSFYLPAGLTLNPTTGVISGTPTEYGTFGPLITAANACDSDTEALVLTIAPSLPAITSPLTAIGNEGVPFNYQITASGSPTGFSGQNLPPGLSVDPLSGVISGAPQVAGTFNSTIWASNRWGTANAILQILVGNAPISGLSIGNVSYKYSVPYLLDFSFTLRDTNDPTSGNALYVDPSLLTATCLEDGEPTSPTETGDFIARSTAKVVKLYLVLDFTESIASLTNGDTNHDGISDAVDNMVNGAIAFSKQQAPDTLIGVYEFHREDQQPARVMAPSTDKTLISSNIAGIWTNYVKSFPAGSVCWDALYAAVSTLGGVKPNEEHYVILVSDGRDESSINNVDGIIGTATNASVKIFCIGFGAELNADPLRQLATRTQGSYYTAVNPGDIANQFTQISKDIKGHYVLRWATLKRTSEAFMPSFTISYQGFSAKTPTNPVTPAVTNITVDNSGTNGPVSVTNITPATTNFIIGYFTQSTNSGNVLVGFLQLVANAEVLPTGVDVRASYLPRYIRQIRLNYRANWPYTVSLQSTNPGELLEGWTMTETNDPVGGKFLLLSSPHPTDIGTSLHFAAFGKLVTFTFRDAIPDVSSLFSVFGVDNTLYTNTGGQSFTVQNASSFIKFLFPAPHGTPIPWLNSYGYSANYQQAELADPDNDGVPNWLEYQANSNATNALSRFVVRTVTRLSNGRFQVTFSTSVNRRYRVQGSTDLVNWQTVQDNIPGTNADVSITDTRYLSDFTKIFYRVMVY
jgi:hypothetical protein